LAKQGKMGNNNKRILLIFFVLLLAACQNNKSSEDPFGYMRDTSGQNIASESPAPEDPSKNIEWRDGNTYSYDYTESISKIDSSGNEQIITVYKRNKPSEDNITCEPKVCKWCSQSVAATSYSIIEYPNLNWLRGEPDFTSIFSMLIGMIGNMYNGNAYFDLENNKVRTEWVTNCDYPGPSGFCSLKCQSEYNSRY
jgi:hypothetical protein